MPQKQPEPALGQRPQQPAPPPKRCFVYKKEPDVEKVDGQWRWKRDVKKGEEIMIPIECFEDLQMHSIVYVLPVTDVRNRARVVVLTGGGLTMRRSGRLPKGAVVMHDARWMADAKAGEKAPLEIGFSHGIKIKKMLNRLHRRNAP